jgi:hypothetical protein
MAEFIWTLQISTLAYVPSISSLHLSWMSLLYNSPTWESTTFHAQFSLSHKPEGLEHCHYSRSFCSELHL